MECAFAQSIAVKCYRACWPGLIAAALDRFAARSTGGHVRPQFDRAGRGGCQMSPDDASNFGLKEADYQTIVRLLECGSINGAAKVYAGVRGCDFNRARANVTAIKNLLNSTRGSEDG